MKLVVGHGYLGSRVARLWRSAGETVFATTRDPRKASDFKASGLRPIVCDVTDPASLTNAAEQIDGVDTVLYAVGFDRTSAHARRDVYVSGLRNVLDIVPTSTQRVICISTTGVYGHDDGGWIDEDSPCQPSRESGRVILDAERQLQSHRLGAKAIILRLAGIYGPARIPSIDDLRHGVPIVASGDGYINLIHVDDAARVIIAAETRTKPPSIYLVSDGHPVLRREFYQKVASVFDTPAPVFEQSSAGADRRGNTSKRVNNARLLAEVVDELEYPTYREGLTAIARATM